MLAALQTIHLRSDPAWPWTATLGLAVLLVFLTVWTYVGVSGASPRRVVILVMLRILALLLAFMAVLRPSLALQRDLFPPSAVILLADNSESMTIRDAGDGQPRWDAVRRVIARCEPLLQRLQDEYNVKVYRHRFAADVGEYDPEGLADGKRTDFGQALTTLLDRYQSERRLRGLLILSDGADNGTRFPVRPVLARRWRDMPCPISTFVVGRDTTSDKQSDLALVDVHADPSPVPIKGALTVTGLINAPGLARSTVTVRLLVDDKEVARSEYRLMKETGNEVQLKTDAPDKPGEIKVTLKVDPLRAEAIRSNNEISTYVPVTKEGLNVLYVEGKYRAWEPKFIRLALAQDPRFRLFETVRLNVDPEPGELGDPYQFDNRHYDVVILGDVSPGRFAAGNPQLLDKLVKLVQEGTGLIMIGGYETFSSRKLPNLPANDSQTWRESPLAQVLPVDLTDEGQEDRPIQMVPTPAGLAHFVMRLADDEKANDELWKKLPKLSGMNRLSEPKLATDTILARADDARTGRPLLMAHLFGKGRVLAFGGDTTYLWRTLGLPESRIGVEAHARFWKQLVLWLAHQEDTSGGIWIRPDVRRLAAGSKLDFTVGARGKTGKALTDARFEVSVVPPAGQPQPVMTTRVGDAAEQRGALVWTETPGEYHIRVRGTAKDVDGTEVTGESTSRFLVYHDDTELARQPSDTQFLRDLAADGGGKAIPLEELEHFLTELIQRTAESEDRSTAQLRPDWNATRLTPFLLGFFLLFVTLLCVEWFLRRFWGLV